MLTALSLSPAVDKIYFVDNFQPGGLFRVGNVVKSAGGKGINGARVASLLGEEVTSLGFKGGSTGEWLESELARLGVDTRFISVEGESRTNNNIIDRVNGVETEVLEVGPTIRPCHLEAFLDLFKETLKHTGVLVCSGGLPEGVPVHFYRTLVELAGASGIPAILDTSNEVLAEGIQGRPYMVKPNRRELSRFAGKPMETREDIVDACRAILAAGVSVVIASLGQEGAVLVTKEVILEASVPDIPVVNTIGSGDSLVAGFAAGTARGLRLEECFRLGLACAQANTQFMEIGFVTRELVEKYTEQILLTRMD